MRISVITINCNNIKGLKRTVVSVINQTYANIEYIIIDGGSDDGSAEYILEMGTHLDYWVSEPDNGIYDAMNKGIDQASGDYLLFLNSGDWLYNNVVLERFVEFNPTEDFVYGNSYFWENENGGFLKIMPEKLEGLVLFERTVNHQCTFFHKRAFAGGRKYDTNYSVLADWALYNKILIEGGSYRHIDLVICFYDFTGLSSNPGNQMKLNADRYKFYGEHADYYVPLLLEIIYEEKNKVRAAKSQLGFKVFEKIKALINL